MHYIIVLGVRACDFIICTYDENVCIHCLICVVCLFCSVFIYFILFRLFEIFWREKCLSCLFETSMCTYMCTCIRIDSCKIKRGNDTFYIHWTGERRKETENEDERRRKERETEWQTMNDTKRQRWRERLISRDR